MIRRQSNLKTLWPLLLRRFAWIAGPATLGIIALIYRYLAGLLLLGHMHAGFQLKEEFFIQMTHHIIGLFAVIMACGRELELRLTPPSS